MCIIVDKSDPPFYYFRRDSCFLFFASNFSYSCFGCHSCFSHLYVNYFRVDFLAICRSTAGLVRRLLGNIARWMTRPMRWRRARSCPYIIASCNIYKKLSILLSAMLKKSARGLFERIQQNKHTHTYTHYTSSRAFSKRRTSCIWTLHSSSSLLLPSSPCVEGTEE